MEKSMMIIKSDWNQQPTFKMVPVSVNCPYVECIYDPESKILALIGNIKKNVFHMMPKLDDNGDIVARKVRTEGSKTYKEERRTVETFQEYYITDNAQISEFVEMFGINPQVATEYLAPAQATA
jgi:hypothetical protein